ncbi:MAG: hypothetical protein NZ874_09710 [Fimbriimonadales bacterium]|nr:hypothetical protein [Fimbriimonadales bacterium]
MYEPLTLKRVAEAIRAELNAPDGDPWLWIRQFMDDFYAAAQEVRAGLIAERPDLTGDPRFGTQWRCWVQFRYATSLRGLVGRDCGAGGLAEGQARARGSA